MTNKELIELLNELAEKDMAEGADIEDHPCTIAARRLDGMSRYKNPEFRKILKDLDVQHRVAESNYFKTKSKFDCGRANGLGEACSKLRKVLFDLAR